MTQITGSCRGWVDESGSNESLDPGSYILAATICPIDIETSVRETMIRLSPHGSAKLHWHDEDDPHRRTIITAVSELHLIHLVVVRAHHLDERPERRRRKCLEQLIPQLETLSVTDLVLESRGRADNKKDVDMLNALRSQHRVTASLVRHEIGRREPLLAIPDAVCGAVTAMRIGNSSYRSILGEQLTMIEI